MSARSCCISARADKDARGCDLRLLLTATIAAALTGARWAYAWVAVELVLGSIRVYLMMKDIESEGRPTHRNDVAPIWAAPRLGYPDFRRLSINVGSGCCR